MYLNIYIRFFFDSSLIKHIVYIIHTRYFFFFILFNNIYFFVSVRLKIKCYIYYPVYNYEKSPCLSE